MAKKLLIIGAGVEQVPAIQIAKEMGYFVITSDYNPKAPGMSLADASFIISTNDKKGNLELARKEQIDGVMTVCSETAIPVMGHVCEQLGLPGFTLDTAVKSTNKGAMRKAMEEYNVPMPARVFVDTYEEVEEFTNQHAGPWVLKPSDSSGQRGTNKIEDRDKLQWAFEEAKRFSTDDKVLLDQFISGQEINVCAIVKNGETHILSLADRNTLPSPHFGIAVLHIAPPNINNEEAEAVKEVARGAVEAIGLKNGIAYPQIIVTKEGPRLIEIAARMPGGYNREMAMNLSGVDMIKAQILLALGEKFELEDLQENKRYAASGVKLLTSVDYPNLTGKSIESLKGEDEALKVSGMQSCKFHLSVGDEIPDLENSVGRFAALIAGGDSKQQVLDTLEEAKSKLIISVK